MRYIGVLNVKDKVLIWFVYIEKMDARRMLTPRSQCIIHRAQYLAHYNVYKKEVKGRQK